MNIELSKEAQESLAAMIEHCLNHHICMGMCEGYVFEGDKVKKEPFRVELEKLLVKLNKE